MNAASTARAPAAPARARPPGAPAPAAGAKPPPLQALWAQRRYFKQAAWLSLASGLLMLTPSWYMLEVYGRVMDSRSLSTLGMLLLCVLGLSAVTALLEQVRARVLGRAAVAMDEQLRRQLFDAAFGATLRREPGGAMHLFNDLKTLREFVPSPAVTSAFDLPAAVLLLGLMFALSPWLGVMVLVGIGILLVLIVSTERVTMPLLTEATAASNGATQYASTTLRNAPVIEAMGMMRGVHARWQQRQRRFLSLQSAASDTAGLNSALGKMVQTMQGSLLLGAAAWLSLNGQLWGGGGMLIVAAIIGGRILSPLSQLVTQWRAVVLARDAYRRLAQALAQHAARPPTMPLPPPKGALTVEAVTVAAGAGGPTILRAVSFAVAPGDALAVIGPAASGKTTLARVVIGLWPTLAGKVRLDGVDVHGWNKDELGPYIGYLPQTVELFDGTLAENIARFGKVDPERVRAAAEQVGILPMVEALPQGFDTRIGDDGAVLSGGQRQRVALARAIYGEPRLIVLDEPNSSLDEAGERSLVELIAALRRRGATVLVITHRATVLPAVNRLLVLRDGQVVLAGPRDEVLHKLKAAADELKAGTAKVRKAGA